MYLPGTCDKRDSAPRPPTGRRKVKPLIKLESPLLRFQALPRSRLSLTCTRLLHRHATPPSPTASPTPERMRELDQIRSSLPMPQPIPSRSDHYLVRPHEAGDRVRQPGQAGDGRAGNEDGRWISDAGSRDRQQGHSHSVPLLHHAIDAVIRRGVSSY